MVLFDKHHIDLKIDKVKKYSSVSKIYLRNELLKESCPFKYLVENDVKALKSWLYGLNESVVLQIKDSDGWSLLHDAIILFHNEIIKLLLNLPSFNVDHACSSLSAKLKNWRPIHVACEAGNVEGLDLLLNYGANPELYVEVVQSELVEPMIMIPKFPTKGCKGVTQIFRENDTLAIIEGWNPLHLSAMHSNVECIRLLIEKGSVFVDARSTVNRKTALILACQLNKSDVNCSSEAIVKILLDNGADPNAIDSRGKSALFYAALNGNSKIVKSLLEKGCDISLLTYKYEMSVFHAACISENNGSMEVLEFLLSNQLSNEINIINCIVDTYCASKTPIRVLHLEFSHLTELVLLTISICLTEDNQTLELQMKKLQFLLNVDKCVNVNSRFCINGISNMDCLQLILYLQYGKHSLVFVNSSLKLKLIDLFLKNSIDINNVNSQSKTSLLYAVEMNMIHLVKKLLELGANPTIPQSSNKMQCLMVAIERQFKDVCHELLQYYKNSSSSAVVVAINKKCESRIVLTNSFSIHSVDSVPVEMVNFTVLHLTIKRGDWQSFWKLILDLEADPFCVCDIIRDGDYMSMVGIIHILIISSNSYDTLEHILDYFIIDCQMSIETATELGDTPFLLAVKFDKVECCRYLMSKGANINAVNVAGENGLIIASMRKNKEILRLLLLSDINVNQLDNNGMSALHYCLDNNFRPGIEMFLSNGFCKCQTSMKNEQICSYCISCRIREKLDFSKLDYKDERAPESVLSCLGLAILNGVEEDVVTLLEQGADIEFVSEYNGIIVTPVFLTLDAMSPATTMTTRTSQAPVKILRHLINYGCNLNYVSQPDEETVLHVALRKEKTDIAKILIYEGVNIEMRCKLYQGGHVLPIHIASQYGQNEIIRLLVMLGTSINSTMTLKNVERVSSLHLASLNDLNDTVRLMIDGCIDNGNSGPQHQLGASVQINSSRSDTFNTLLTMVSKKNVQGVRDLLRAGVDVNCRCVVSHRRNASCLHFAAQVGHTEIVRLLLEQGADPLARMITGDSDGILPIHLAVESGHMEIVKLFLNWGVSAGAVEDRGLSCLHYAAKAGNLSMVKLLIEAGADVNSEATDEDQSKMLPIHMAAEKGHLCVVKELIKHGSRFDSVFTRSTRSNLTALYIATSESRVDVVQFLLKCGANPNIRESNLGAIPMHIMCQKGYLHLLNYLIGLGSSQINLTLNTGISALHLTAEKGYEEITFWLLRAGANPNEKGQITDSYSMKTSYLISPLNQACGFGHQTIVDLLISNGADIHWPEIFEGNIGITPIHCAAIRGRYNVIPCLIAAGVDINRQDANGRTPLHWAIMEGHFDCANILIELGANTEVTDQIGSRPIDYATTSNLRSLFR